ncbi:hypothetical protein [Catellatospora sichuanensis]|uniref:hypothetical protein n=1 Tax=Catellatospora sichuanensis TaxID=1969805 RepID=UPI0016429B98|nr:hypothetical protein [Catellatospora sichuanensis]
MGTFLVVGAAAAVVLPVIVLVIGARHMPEGKSLAPDHPDHLDHLPQPDVAWCAACGG